MFHNITRHRITVRNGFRLEQFHHFTSFSFPPYHLNIEHRITTVRHSFLTAHRIEIRIDLVSSISGLLSQGYVAKQLIPPEHHLIEVQFVQHDLRNAHEHFFPF